MRRPRLSCIRMKTGRAVDPVLRMQPPRVQHKCTALIELLAARGNELRRPHADYLREGLYELRPTVGRCTIAFSIASWASA